MRGAAPLARALAVALAVACSLAPDEACAAGPAVSLSGSLGSKALLVIDGQPHTLDIGQTVQGVKLRSVGGSDAVVEIDRQRVALSLGRSPVSLGGSASDAATVVLKAGSGGHFVGEGSINGHAVRFLVDTGATYVALGAAQADRLGIDYLKGARGVTGTANGQVVVYRVSLASVQLGGVLLYNVDAVIVPQPMDQVLLGNSFLARFDMQRASDTLTLVKRY